MKELIRTISLSWLSMIHHNGLTVQNRSSVSAAKLTLTIAMEAKKHKEIEEEKRNEGKNEEGWKKRKYPRKTETTAKENADRDSIITCSSPHLGLNSDAIFVLFWNKQNNPSPPSPSCAYLVLLAEEEELCNFVHGQNISCKGNKNHRNHHTQNLHLKHRGERNGMTAWSRRMKSILEGKGDAREAIAKRIGKIVRGVPEEYTSQAVEQGLQIGSHALSQEDWKQRESDKDERRERESSKKQNM